MQTFFFLTKILNKILQYNICKSEELKDFIEAGYRFFWLFFVLFVFILSFEGPDS